MVDDDYGRVPTMGKSRCFFYQLDSNPHFIVKGIHADEKDKLLEILPSYTSYCETQVHTLLSRYLMLMTVMGYAVVDGRVSISEEHVVIMCSFFPSVLNDGIQVHRSYDLKGSAEGRLIDDASKANPLFCRRDPDFINM